MPRALTQPSLEATIDADRRASCRASAWRARASRSPASIRTPASMVSSDARRRPSSRRRSRPAARAGIDVSGPFPGDTVFLRAHRGEFDVVVACYHDQGLIPVKLVAFGEAVNVTLGLPIVRTSVDHGTAFDIAGKGVANPESMIAAVLLAAQSGRSKGPALRRSRRPGPLDRR